MDSLKKGFPARFKRLWRPLFFLLLLDDGKTFIETRLIFTDKTPIYGLRGTF